MILGFQKYDFNFDSRFYLNNLKQILSETYFLQVVHTKQGHDHGVNLDVCFGKEDPTTFFNDGVRKIDFVLVVEENVKDFAESDGFGEGFNANENIDDSSK